MLIYFILTFIAGFLLSWFIFKRLAVKQLIKNDTKRFMNDIKMRVGKEYYPTFTPYINSISPQFVKIYDETLLAENQELYSIIGISYGKSLEFLIRDYAIAQNPTGKEKILKVKLVDVINNYILDNSIKNSTDIARWLRNDETHYQRKFEKADVNHLKQLIQLTVALINAEHDKRQIDNKVETIKKNIS